MFASNFAAYEY